MQIVVNGVSQEVLTHSNVLQLLERFKIAPEQIAVEVNLTIINHEAYYTTILNEGDKVEIIRFIGGGSYGG